MKLFFPIADFGTWKRPETSVCLKTKELDSRKRKNSTKYKLTIAYEL